MVISVFFKSNLVQVELVIEEGLFLDEPQALDHKYFHLHEDLDKDIEYNLLQFVLEIVHKDNVKPY